MPTPPNTDAANSPLAAIMALAGGGLSGTVGLLDLAAQIDALADATGYPSLRTFALAFRQMHDDIANDTRMPL